MWCRCSIRLYCIILHQAVCRESYIIFILKSVNVYYCHLLYWSIFQSQPFLLSWGWFSRKRLQILKQIRRCCCTSLSLIEDRQMCIHNYTIIIQPKGFITQLYFAYYWILSTLSENVALLNETKPISFSFVTPIVTQSLKRVTFLLYNFNDNHVCTRLANISPLCLPSFILN